MSQPDLGSASSAPSVLNKKPQLNIYTTLLVIALVALLLGCLFMGLELRQYELDASGQLTWLSQPLYSLGDVPWA